MRFNGRRILITGGASGIGLESARQLVADGARVALLDRDVAGLAQAAAVLGMSTAIEADVTDAASVRGAVDQAAQALGGIDGLINAAGIDLWKPFEELTFEDWRRVQSIDLDGPFLVSHAVLPHLRAAGGGSVVNLASGAGMRPLPNLSAYCVAKAGVVMLTRAMALDLVKYNIRVNAVAPGPIHTPMLESTLRKAPDRRAAEERFFARVGMRRFGQADEVARAVCFLLGPDSSFTTGAVLEIDGGRVYV
jgi:NAD(P)-dependent dehydrogenase (short-subunit alcohol dehydrogenase family)